MKVLFINTTDLRGGAAIVARRLSENLESKYNAQCFFIVAYKTGNDSNVFSSRRTMLSKFIEKVIDKLCNAIGLQYQFLPITSTFILKSIKQLKPDVISLHNTHGGYFQTSLIKEISKLAPIVWTLHDMWSFTGNSAHTFGDTSWKEMKNSKHLIKISPAIGINTGAFLLKRKSNIYKQSNLTIVTPSKWLGNLAQQSPVFVGQKIIHINNGVDLDLFKSNKDNAIRDKFNIPSEAKVLMFSAEILTGNIWKGGDDLLKVLKVISDKINSNVHIFIIGKGEIEAISDLPNFTVHQIGYIKEEKEMAAYLSASNLFVYPTKADNLPNILIEAIACGTPCITFGIGGCAEIIMNDYNGVIINPFEFDKMALAIIELLENEARLKEMTEHSRLYAEANFSIDAMSEKYINLFRSITTFNP